MSFLTYKLKYKQPYAAPFTQLCFLRYFLSFLFLISFTHLQDSYLTNINKTVKHSSGDGGVEGELGGQR